MTMKRNTVAVLVTVFCISILLLPTSCGQKAANKTAEKIIEKSAAKAGQSADVKIDPESKSFSMTTKDENGQQQTMQINVDDENTSMVITGEDGNVSMTSGAAAHVPEGFPTDVPIHPSLKLVTTLSDGNSGFTLNCTSDKTIEELVKYYQEAAVKSGWTEQMNMSQNPSAPMQILVYNKDERSLNLIFQKQEEEVTLTIGIGKA